MSSVLLDAPALGHRTAGGRRPTLAELLAGTLNAARNQAEADCPVCHSTMHLEDGGVARCAACGTTLS
jgi:hypothetical protein